MYTKEKKKKRRIILTIDMKFSRMEFGGKEE